LLQLDPSGVVVGDRWLALGGGAPGAFDLISAEGQSYARALDRDGVRAVMLGRPQGAIGQASQFQPAREVPADREDWGEISLRLVERALRWVPGRGGLGAATATLPPVDAFPAGSTRALSVLMGNRGPGPLSLQVRATFGGQPVAIAPWAFSLPPTGP